MTNTRTRAHFKLFLHDYCFDKITYFGLVLVYCNPNSLKQVHKMDRNGVFQLRENSIYHLNSKGCVHSLCFMCVMGQSIKDIQNSRMSELTDKEKLRKLLFDLEGAY